MADDFVTKEIKKSKELLAKGSRLTQSVEGNPTSAFAPKAPAKPHVPQAEKPSYSMAAEARNVGEGLKAKQDNVNQYLNAAK